MNSPRFSPPSRSSSRRRWGRIALASAIVVSGFAVAAAPSNAAGPISITGESTMAEMFTAFQASTDNVTVAVEAPTTPADVTLTYEWITGPSHAGATCSIVPGTAAESTQAFLVECQDDGTIRVTASAADISLSKDITVTDQPAEMRTELPKYFYNAGEVVDISFAVSDVGPLDTAECESFEVGHFGTAETVLVPCSGTTGVAQLPAEAPGGATLGYSAIGRTTDGGGGQFREPFTRAEWVVANAAGNTPITAVDDAVEMTNNGTPINIQAYRNDFDPDSELPGVQAATVVTQPANGTVINPPGNTISFEYLPNAGFAGVDTFTYTVTDEFGDVSNVATVTVTVLGNDQLRVNLSVGPIIRELSQCDSETLLACNYASASTTGAVGTVSYEWSYEWTSGPTHAGATCQMQVVSVLTGHDVAVLCNDDGEIRLAVTATDTSGFASASAVVTVTDTLAHLSISTPRSENNVAQHSVGEAVAIQYGTVDTGTLDSTSCVSIDPGDGSPAIPCSGTSGTVEHTYTTAGAYNFGGSTSDGGGGTGPILGIAGPPRIVVIDGPPNQQPTAVADEFSVPPGVDAVLTPLANDTDPDGDTLTIISLDSGQHGTSELLADGTVKYHGDNQGQTDTLTYVISDGQGGNAQGTMTITIGVILTAPTAPPLAEATNLGGGRVEVQFSPSEDGGSPITGYTATCASTTGGATKTASGPASPITVTGLSSGATYTCTVTATNDVGTSEPSPASNSFTVLALPSAPRSATASTTTVGRQLKVRVTAPASNGGSPVTAYNVTCSTMTAGASDRSTVYRPAAGTNPATVDVLVGNLTPGALYRCSATATNAVGAGLSSALGNAVTIPALPGAPTVHGVFATGSSGRVAVRVSPPRVTGGVAITYHVECSSRTGARRAVTAPAGTGRTDIIVSGLTRRATYRCAVWVSNISGNGASATSVAFRAP